MGADAVPPEESSAQAEANAEAESMAARGTINRAALESVLEAGLGRFLQGVETEPQMEAGRFVGFRLGSLFPGDARMASIDLRVGDVVTRVNGAPIERPEQALSVWNGLRVASELRIEYQRDGAERELRFEIVD